MTWLSLSFEGTPLKARAGESIAAALLRAGITGIRHAPDGLRGPVCGMGVCFECRISVARTDRPARTLRACITQAEDGMILHRAADSLTGLSVKGGTA